MGCNPYREGCNINLEDGVINGGKKKSAVMRAQAAKAGLHLVGWDQLSHHATLQCCNPKPRTLNPKSQP